MTKDDMLAALAARIAKHRDWWIFPSEKAVRGFFGTDPLFIVGDQPSTSQWPESNPNRRLFYDLLVRLGAHNAHLTDLYKRRGSASSLSAGDLPNDFEHHCSVFREELSILQPARVIALSQLAFDLLRIHVPQVAPNLTYMWHFAWVQRQLPQRPAIISEWEEMTRQAISAPIHTAPKPPRTNRTGLRVPTNPRNHKSTHESLTFEEPETMQNTYMQASQNDSRTVERLSEPPKGIRPRCWVLRDDNHQHYHSVLSLSEDPTLLELRWKPNAQSAEQIVGLFLLHLRRLLKDGYIRFEPKDKPGDRVRVRFFRGANGMVYVQPSAGEPSLRVGQVAL